MISINDDSTINRKPRGRMRMLVLATIGSSINGLTCEEIETALSLRHQSASARVCELHKAGSIANSGRKRKTKSGCMAVVYVVTAPGFWLDVSARAS